LRDGIDKFTDEVGNLWSRLANLNVKKGKFEEARRLFLEVNYIIFVLIISIKKLF